MSKRSGLMIVCNGAPFINAQLSHLYNVLDEIIIVEGPDATFEKIIGSRRSNDGTIEIINDFISKHDHSKKIKLIHANVDKNEMVRIGNRACNGDYIYQIDVDEFVNHEGIEAAFKILESRKYEVVRIPQRWFYKWPDVYLQTLAPWSIAMIPIRFYLNKRDKGWLINHIPADRYRCEKTKIHEVTTLQSQIDDSLYAYHFCALTEKQYTDKLKYYSNRGDGISSKQVHDKIEEFKSTTRNDIGKIIRTYHNYRLAIEERLFPVSYVDGKLEYSAKAKI